MTDTFNLPQANKSSKYVFCETHKTYN